MDQIPVEAAQVTLSALACAAVEHYKAVPLGVEENSVDRAVGNALMAVLRPVI